GIAGAIFAYLLQGVTADSFGVFKSLEYVAAVVIGGLGSWSGAIVSGSIFAALPQLLTGIAKWVPVIEAGLLTLTPVFRPEGLGFVLNRGISIPLPWVPSRKRERIGDVRTAIEIISQPKRA